MLEKRHKPIGIGQSRPDLKKILGLRLIQIKQFDSFISKKNSAKHRPHDPTGR